MTTYPTLAFATKRARIGRRFLAALTLIYPVVAVAAESGLVFPADGGVLDVRAFGGNRLSRTVAGEKKMAGMDVTESRLLLWCADRILLPRWT